MRGGTAACRSVASRKFGNRWIGNQWLKPNLAVGVSSLGLIDQAQGRGEANDGSAVRVAYDAEAVDALEIGRPWLQPEAEDFVGGAA